MSRHTSREHSVANGGEMLEVIREEQRSPSASVNLDTAQPDIEKDDKTIVVICPCKDYLDEQRKKENELEVERILKEREGLKEEEFQKRLEQEVRLMKERFEFILRNEQIRSSCMLREAHRERKEKISALQTQLECKNLAGLMYVLCTERRKNKLELLRVNEEYIKYITGLQKLLTESQQLILHLSRGYKATARVDKEWRNKMEKVIGEFQNFVYHFAGGTPDVCQYFFDIPELMKTKASIQDDPSEDPCECGEEAPETEVPKEKTWWENLDKDSRPFVVFGDMADFQPQQRREVLKAVKATKTAPRKWKEYVFNDKFFQDKCKHLEKIKHEVRHPGDGMKWVCNLQTPHQSKGYDDSMLRTTSASVDIRGNMGSILKMITSSATTSHAPARATLLGAKDSMEITSTTRLREKQRHSTSQAKVVLNIGNKIDSMLTEEIDYTDCTSEQQKHSDKHITSRTKTEDGDMSLSALGSIHNDSLQVIPTHVPDQDHSINYEKVCLADKCQRMHEDEFMDSLPPYMRASPFTHFEQTYEGYEACSPEQLKILEERLEERKKKEKEDAQTIEVDPLEEWTPSDEGVAMQTSDRSLSLPPCTCRVPGPSPLSSLTSQLGFHMMDLIPIKEKLDNINKYSFFDERIDFNRFQVIGQDSNDYIKTEEKDFSTKRLDDLKKILRQHPSLCEMFQANIQC